MAKKIFYDDEARARVLAGAEELYNAVKVTMGPKGRNVVISKSYGGPTITHDGVTVAKAVDIEAKDDETLGRSVGADLIKQAASKTADNVGDGTTTSTVLAYHILNEANRLIAAGHNPMDLRKGLDEAAAQILDQIGELTEQIADNKDKIAQVATISAGDPELGKMIADVIATVGNDGSVTVEPSQTLATEVEIVEGFKVDRGYISPHMVTDAARMEASYDKPLILVTDKRITTLQEILPLINLMMQEKKNTLVIVADDLEGDALANLMLNKLKGVFNTLAVKAPGYGERRKQILADIATLTGATVVSEEEGFTFDNISLEVLGSARRVIAGRDETTIIEGGGDAEAIGVRQDELKAQIANATGEYEAESLELRLAALVGKVAVIKVGGATETEVEEKKFRVDDAVSATKAAVAEGIVPGGGVTLVDLSKTLAVEATKIGSSIEAGHLVLKKALVQPFRILMSNAGLNADEKLPKVLEQKKRGQGFNVHDGSKMIDLKTEGVVDPARVTREAIQNAVSVAGVAMTMGSLIVDIPEERPTIVQPMNFQP
jgi:chaperonin GroEL